MYISISCDDIKLRNLYRTRNTVEKHGYNAHVIQDDGHSYKCIVSTCVYVTYVRHDIVHFELFAAVDTVKQARVEYFSVE